MLRMLQSYVINHCNPPLPTFHLKKTPLRSAPQVKDPFLSADELKSANALNPQGVADVGDVWFPTGILTRSFLSHDDTMMDFSKSNDPWICDGFASVQVGEAWKTVDDYFHFVLDLFLGFNEHIPVSSCPFGDVIVHAFQFGEDFC